MLKMAPQTSTTGKSLKFILFLLLLNTLLILVRSSSGPVFDSQTGGLLHGQIEEDNKELVEDQRIITSSSSVMGTIDKNMMSVGGGAINEKERQFMGDGSGNGDDSCVSLPSSSSYDPVNIRSHLEHSLEGLDRYPNYLSRYSFQDMDTLEEALIHRLELVRIQRQKITQQRDSINQVVSKLLSNEDEENNQFKTLLVETPITWGVLASILDSRAFNCINRFRSKLNSSTGTTSSSSLLLQDILIGKIQVELDTGYLEELMDEELYDVYSFPLLKPEFCETLQRYIRAVNDGLLKQQQDEESSKNNNEKKKNDISTTLGIRDLDRIGLSWLNDVLFHLILKPISRHLFKETETMGGELDWRQGYIAPYSASPSSTKPRQKLVPHTDDSEVTLNVCIGDVFSGGNLRFRNLRGATTSRAGHDLLGEYKPEIGRAIIHAGRHFHEVTEVTSGDRFAYIMWARSWSGVRAMTCPCCWLNRRTDNSCICGRRWN